MRVLQVNGYQSPGRRFNGLAITPLLKQRGIDSEHIVWLQDKVEPGVSTINTGWTRRINRTVARIEKRLSVQSLLYPHAGELARLEQFRRADVLHLHIIHSGYMSVWSLPWLAKRKPLVWTLHDPWALTGHCIHPGDCQRWRTGCGQCPALDTPFPLRVDRTRFLFGQKQRAYARTKVDLVVASEWMLRHVEASPLFRGGGVRLHHIPFGIDLDRFSPAGGSEARARLGIPHDHVVLMFRAEGDFKGVPYILDALQTLQVDRPITLLTVGKTGVVDGFRGRYGVVELGWTNDEDAVAAAFKAADLFLMPSTAETFGVMAVEALASGRPVVCFDGTALPGVVDAPRVGVSVPMRDAAALRAAIERLVHAPEERVQRGRDARALAERLYSIEQHVQRIADLYRDVVSRCA